MTPEGALALAMESANLRDLERWPPCGSLFEDLRLALHGEGALTRSDVDRLRRWARRWSRMPVRLRPFYIQHIDRQEVQRALWALLETDERPSRVTRGMVTRLFIDMEGFEPSFTVCPSLVRSSKVSP